ncbi:MAG TPA: glutamine--fructose-6-phosphate transaminase (isomerizing) [Dehalococcoidia bacterium]|nr:glutamine--fructose-6-phosphate transaminase (isomerizing) [Dehalococcoidia bacterium]
MCGIVGYVGDEPAGPILLDGLRRLEYRGYDSAGVAILSDSGDISITKRAGKLDALVEAFGKNGASGRVGMGHTRWATHGAPTDLNAHPQADCTGDVVVIHNGIVENYLELKRELIAGDHKFQSETDTEVIAHLVEKHLEGAPSLAEAVRLMSQEIRGAHAIVVMHRKQPDTLVATRIGNAGGVVVGYGDGRKYIASDIPALLDHTREVVFLADGEIATLRSDDVAYIDAEGNQLDYRPQSVPYDPVSAAKGNYRHFELKEMMEQPESVLDTIRGRVDFEKVEVNLEDVHFSDDEVKSLDRVVLIGMGTSMHAEMIGRIYFERIAGLPAEFDNASEFRYRKPVINERTLVVSISQSGETVDTLAGMNMAKELGARQITICNTVGAESTRVAEGVIYTRCGPEIGVASTKTFAASVAALYLLACRIGFVRGYISKERLAELLRDLARMPQLIGEALKSGDAISRYSLQFSHSRNFLFLGRGINYPVAMEGALKLKELSYIHAEGYPAGEMKHGPIALIDYELPVVAIAPRDRLFEKILSNIEQVKARQGIVIAIGEHEDPDLKPKVDRLIYVPRAPELLSPLVTVVPCQFLAYHIAVQRGCDVDQPRNLAKTVTVE